MKMCALAKQKENAWNEDMRNKRRRRIFCVWLNRNPSPNLLNENKRIRIIRVVKLSTLEENARQKRE
jgi:hypothetical protein